MEDNDRLHTMRVGKARVTIERVIGRVKQFYALDRPSLITVTDIAEQMFHV